MNGLGCVDGMDIMDGWLNIMDRWMDIMDRWMDIMDGWMDIMDRLMDKMDELMMDSWIDSHYLLTLGISSSVKNVTACPSLPALPVRP